MRRAFYLYWAFLILSLFFLGFVDELVKAGILAWTGGLLGMFWFLLYADRILPSEEEITGRSLNR